MVQIQQWLATGRARGDVSRKTARGTGPEPLPAVGSGENGNGSAREAALLQAGQAGDRAALEQLLAPHRRPLLALCQGILAHAEDAEDAAQETFLRVLRALSSFRGDASFRSWLFRIAVNVCLKRKSRHRPTEAWDDQHPGAALDSASPEAIALRHLRVMEALQALPPRHRAILLLKEREGWSVAEIAAVMGWSPIRVKNELSKARRTLVEWRQREAGEGDEQ
jgi:RNA polymerase sigma-70 factor (ECF subfamily)